MNAERLLQHYEQIADAPDAIVRLRRFILDLAVRGKLVPQDTADEPASELLKRIEAERAAIGRNKKTNVVSDDIIDAHDELPTSWVWSTFNEISLRLHYGFTASADQNLTAVRLLRITDIQDGKVDWNSVPGCAIDDKAASAYLLEAGDILIARTGGTIGKTFLVSDAPVKSVFASYLIRLQPARTLLDRYIKLFCDTTLYWEQLTAGSRGGGQPNVNGQTLGNLRIPLAPLAEQHRIVAKVDALMALCDGLEAARTERETKRDRLAAASLARLNTPDPETFRDDARFALDALPALTARPDQIKQLRQTILNLAVRGKLVPQDPADEQAVELQKRISEQRAERATKDIIPKPKSTNRDVARLADVLPVGWSPIALGDVCDLITSGSRGWGEYYADSGPGFVRAQNIRFGRMRLDELACVRPPSNTEGSRTQVYRNDLLIVITGAGVTNPALLEEDLGEAYVSQHVGLVRPSDTELSRWMLLCLMADAGGRGELLECAYGAGKPGLNLDNIRSLSIPLPPLAEQHRIVAKVDELMALCDQLEASLTSADDTRKKLLDALLAEALAPVDADALEEAAE